MTKIKIMYIEENQDGTTGGSHYCLLNLVEKLDKGAFSPIVVFYENNRFIDKLRRTGVKVIVVNRSKGLVWIPAGHEKMRVGYTALLLLLRMAQKCVNLFRIEIIPFIIALYVLLKFDIDIVHLNNSLYSGAHWSLAAKLLGKKVVIHQRALFGSSIMPLKINCFSRPHVFCVSRSIREEVLALGIPPARCSVLYDTVEADHYDRAEGDGREIRREFHVGETQPLILIVGNIKRWKGQLVLVEALGMLPPESVKDVRCLIVGDASSVNRDDAQYLQEIKEKIEDLCLAERVMLTGFRRDIASIMDACDIFVHASISPEPYGLVILEAMRAGKPIVVSDQGGPAEMVEDGVTGFLISPNKPKLLAEKIRMLIEDKPLRDFLGAHARKRYENNFSFFDVGSVESIYKDLVS